MFLYENNDQFIDIYKLEPELEEIKKYRIDEMEKIPQNKRVWVAQTNSVNHKILETSGISISYDKLNCKALSDILFTFSHSFKTSRKLKQNKQYLQYYYEDDEFIYRLCKIRKDSEWMYILFLEDEYTFSMTANESYTMDGIINIPESLYLLEALLQGNFNLLGDKDITEQLKLFDIQHIGRINTDILKNICEYQLLTDSYDSIIHRTNVNKDVVNKVKKLAR